MAMSAWPVYRKNKPKLPGYSLSPCPGTGTVAQFPLQYEGVPVLISTVGAVPRGMMALWPIGKKACLSGTSLLPPAEQPPTSSQGPHSGRDS